MCMIITGHQDKANVLQFHPQANSLLASAGYDCRLLLWDISSLSVVLTLDKLPEPVRLALILLSNVMFLLPAILYVMES